MNPIKSFLFYLFFIAVLVACEAPPRMDGANKNLESTGFITTDSVSPDEEYVMITTAIRRLLKNGHRKWV
jgi:hypothetical protein